MIELKINPVEMKGTWEKLVPSDSWEYVGEYLIAPVANREYAVSVDDDNPWYIEDSPFGGPIASPALLHIIAFVAANLICQISNSPEARTLHAKQVSEFINPVRVGKKVKIEGRVRDKCIKRGKKYFAMEARLTDEDGVPVLLYKHTRAFIGGLSNGSND